MHAPLISTITLFSELIVSAIVYYTLYKGYKHNKFPSLFAAGALLYETIFNITYMVSRVPSQAKVGEIEPVSMIVIAAVHGILSLIMFISLVVFFILAWRKYKKGINYFKTHKYITFIFLFFWTFSIVSGILFYLVDYVF